MRRGWMNWLADEVPVDELARRIGDVAKACRTQGVDALLLYGTFVRPARLSALTHFVPFWSQAALVVTRDGHSLLTMATTGRTVQLIRQCSVVEDVQVGPDIGEIAARWLQQRQSGPCLALADMEDWPQSILERLRQAWPEASMMNAQPWYDALDAGFGPTPVVAVRAQALGQAGLNQVVTVPLEDGHDIVAAVDGYCRTHGAEEVSVLVATDLEQSALYRRLEGSAPLGSLFAVQLSLAYKGFWLRYASSFRREGKGAIELPVCTALRQQLLTAAFRPGMRAVELVQEVAAAKEIGVLQDWALEARKGQLPLACVGAMGHAQEAQVPPFATFSVRFVHDGHPCWLTEPLVSL